MPGPGEDRAGDLTRRRLLQTGGSVAAGLLTGAGGATAAARAGVDLGGTSGERLTNVPFDAAGPQAGIVDVAPLHLSMAAFDLDGSLRGAAGRRELADLLRDWSAYARALMAGAPPPASAAAAGAIGAAADTGEAAGLGSQGLRITIGFGPDLFAPDRDLGLPAPPGDELGALPAFRGDALRANWSGGALLVSAAADDPQVALHAMRNLALVARGAAALRWVQRGFLPSRDAGTPRNLLGFKDGTANLAATDPSVARRTLWVGQEGPGWLRGGGTYAVVRRIRMQLQRWDSETTQAQEEAVGREKASGAPIGSRDEHDPVELDAVGSDGLRLIPAASHVGVARRAGLAGHSVLRRPYSFADGVDPADAGLDAGLIFIAFQRSIGRQFVPLQRAIAEGDAMGAYVEPVGSAVFAIPPASRGPSDWVGRALLAP